MFTVEKYKDKLDDVINKLNNNFLKLRAGVANPKAFENIMVYCYEEYHPLNHTSSISAPDAFNIVIKPFDISQLKHITEAIIKFDDSLNPSNEGNIIRIKMQPLTAEKRKSLVREAKAYTEQAKVNLRNIRREIFTEIKNLKESSDNEKIIFEEEAQNIIDTFSKKIDKLSSIKEQDLTRI